MSLRPSAGTENLADAVDIEASGLHSPSASFLRGTIASTAGTPAAPFDGLYLPVLDAPVAARTSLALDCGSIAASRHEACTDQVPIHQRSAYWLDLMCSTYIGVEHEARAGIAFRGEISSLRLGCLAISHVRTNAIRVHRTPEGIRRDPESHYIIQVQRSGCSVVSQDGRCATLKAGDFALYDSNRPFELVFDEHGHDITTLRVPCSALDIHVSNIQELSASTIAASSAPGRMLSSMLSMLERDYSRLTPSAALSMSEAITSLIAAGLRSVPTANHKRPSSLQAYHVGRVHAYVNDHLRDPDLSVASIARAIDMSADHLSRIFKHEPMPLSKLIWQSRLAACTNDLRDSKLRHRSISEIAFAWGFNDAAHFSRAFKERHGMSPRQWRARQSLSL